MGYWGWLILFVIVAWIVYKNKTSQLPEKVSFLYYSNVVPALEQSGFQGEPGFNVERLCWIESVYYLDRISVAVSKADFKLFRANEDRASHSYFSVNDGESGNRYRVAFSATLRNGRNSATLSLSVHNNEKEDELGKFGTTLTEYFAPIHYFNSANLRLMLSSIFWDIHNFEQSLKPNRHLYVYGATLTQSESALQGAWLPLIYPDGNETSEKSKKGAYKIMKKGYPNSIVTAS